MPRVGEEVLIDHIGGDCDRPVVISRLYNGSAKPQWHSNGLLSGYRSKEYGGSGYNQMVMDDATGQNRVQLFSSTANSQLHLGYLVQHTDNTRGAYLGTGFDLKSESYGAIRAGQGLFVSTHPTSASQPLNVTPASEQLVSSEALVKNLSQSSIAANAETLQPAQDALKVFTDATRHSVSGSANSGGHTAGGGTGNANGFANPILLAASPAGIALSTQQSTQITADKQINLVSGQNIHVATGKSLIASVTEKISLFVQNAGIKLFAGKGHVQVQAQSDAIELTAQKGVTMISATDMVTVTTKKGILLTSGGAYIRIADGNIQIHAPGTVDVKGASHDFSGWTRLDTAFPSWVAADGKPKRSTSFSG
ncbi:uncharacterized protein (DUF2345 family) [Paraburkholderia sp. GAS333]